MTVNIDNAEHFDPDQMQRAALIWDGDCGFCKRSVLRLADSVGERLRYVTYQRVHDRFDEIDEEDFERSVHLVEPDGRVYTGAEAIFRALDRAPGGSRLLSLYEHIPGFGPVSEWVYRRIANNRPLASKVSRWLIGRDMRPPSWKLARWLFLRLLGLIGLVAFASYFVQMDGLIGSEGIVPAADVLEQMREQLEQRGEASGLAAFLRAPTLLWAGAGDGALTAVCGAGMVASGALIVGLWPRLMLFVMWLTYLSFVTASGPFMQFQWDILFVETSFLAMFLAPSGFIERRHERVSRLGLALMLWLLFRLMFLSGVVKLTSGDETWRDLSAMTYHYMTQPLPNPVSHWAHHLPDWFHRLESLGTLAIEIGAPFLLLAPRRVRRVGAVVLGLLQVAIIATGNYGFFNLLALALCLLALDDRPLERFVPERWLGWIRGERGARPAARGALRRGAAAGAVVLLVAVSGLQTVQEIVQKRLVPEPVETAYRPFRTINNYGLFRTMTTDRPEILVEGTTDGQTWKRYDFAYKPDKLDEAPPVVAPHMPRLDWQMWFAALGDCRANPWILRFQKRLLEGNEDVLELLDDDPFDGEAPRRVRTTMWQYDFTTPEKRADTGRWWKREEAGAYCPEFSLHGGNLRPH
ncbi:MAG: lipase maturation factor family protein [Persicimonas sp.]